MWLTPLNYRNPGIRQSAGMIAPAPYFPSDAAVGDEIETVLIAVFVLCEKIETVETQLIKASENKICLYLAIVKQLILV